MGRGSRATINAFLSARYPNLEASSTTEIKNRLEDQVNQQFNLFNAILLIAVVVSLLGVVNTLAMSVIGRTRDIGVLRALGSSRAQIRHETVTVGVASVALGVLAAVLPARRGARLDPVQALGYE